MIEKKKIDCNKLLILIAFILVISLPIYLYQYKFGTALSNDRDIWGQFGSYISGIYAPFFSFLTLFLLYRQNKAQVKMDNYQRTHNEATQIRSDADFYLSSLDKSLKGEIAVILKNNFSTISAIELNDDHHLISANRIHEQNQIIRNSWIGFNIALKSLKIYENTSFEYYYRSVRLIPITMHGYDCCVALDNYCYIQSQGEFRFNEYSEVVAKNT